MIEHKCFTNEWIQGKAAEIGSRNPVMLEKATVALQLLGNLAESGLPFQFKGGTSLLLRLSPIRRLSIDVDIVTQASFEDLTAALESLGKNAPFSGYRHDALRDKESPPKKHFKVFYPSAIEPKSDHVLLDVLFDAATDLQEVAEVYETIHAKQLGYRSATFTIADTLNDTMTAGFQYGQLDLRGGTETPEGLMIKDGVGSLQNHLINLPFSRDEARIAVGKAACLAACIRHRKTGLEPIEKLRFESITGIRRSIF